MPSPQERLAALRVRAVARRKKFGEPYRGPSEDMGWLREAQWRTEAWKRA